MKIRHILKKTALPLAVLFAGVGFLLCRESVSAGVKEGLRLCGEVLIPSMFPFMVLASFSLNAGVFDRLSHVFSPLMNRLFALSGACFPVIFFGAVGGYPVGAKMIGELYDNGVITKNDAERLFSFCVNAGPAFIVSAVGGAMLGSPKAGYMMLLAVLAASAITGMLFSLGVSRHTVQSVIPKKRMSFSDSVTSSVSAAMHSTFSVCAWVLVFSAFSGLIEPYIRHESGRLCFEMLAEVTTGVRAAIKLGGIPLAAAVISFGGICVMCQLLPFIKKCGIKVKKYLVFRMVNALLSYVLTRILLCFTDVSVSVSALFDVNPFSRSAPASAALLMLGASLIFSLSQRKEDSAFYRSI